MELMNLSNVHFIQAIKGGSVVKVLNVNSLGRPAVKVKSIKAIYQSKDVRNLGSKPLLQQQEAVLTDSPLSCDIVERASFPMDRITVKSEPETWELNEDDVCSNQRTMEDDTFPDMTLRELRSRCRAKRKKNPKANDMPKKKMKSCASPDTICSKQSHAGVRPRKDECDLDESLSSLKKKLSKKSKAKRKCTKDLVPITVKIENLEPDDNVIGAAEHISSPGQDSVEPDGGELETGESSSLTEESESCVVNEISCQCLEIEPLFLPLSENESVEDIIAMDFSLSEEYQSYVFNEVLYEYLELDEPLSLPVSEDEIAEANTEVDSLPVTVYKSLPSFLCEPIVKEGKIAHSPPQAILVTDCMPLSSRVCEPMKEGNIAHPPPQAIPVTGYEYLPSLVCEHMKKDNIAHSPLQAIPVIDVESLPSVVCEPIKEGNIAHSPPLCSSAEAILVTENPDSEIYRSCKDFSCSQEIPCPIDSNTVTQMSKMSINDSLECVQQNSGDDGCDSEMVAECGSKEDTPNLEDHVLKISESLCISSQNSSPCFNPNAASDSVDDDSPTIEKYPSLINEGTVSSVVGAGDCSSGTPPDATDRLTVMDALVNDRSPHIQYPPKRLFSTRKVISPCSQEKLRRAMDEDELYDHIKRSRLGLEGAKIIFSPERSFKRRKTGSSQSVRKGILKSPSVSCVPRSVTECVSIQTCAQKAIEFSQRQMRDIEGLAVKLVRELRTMKDIVEETLLTQAQSSSQSTVTVDKMRIATENAVEAEDTTRKWLSMMGKDCNRFCKIMRSMEKKVAAAATSGKERKKITFADEAGGVLCHFKLIEDRSASESEKVDQNL